MPRAGIFASAKVASGPPPVQPFFALRSAWGQSGGVINRTVTIGPDDPNRKLVISLASQSTVNFMWTTLLFDGIATGLVNRVYRNNRNRLWIYEIPWPTGSSVVITASHNGSTNNLGAGVYTTLGSYVEGQSASLALAPSVAMPLTLTGDALVATSMGWANSTSPVWSGGPTEDAVGGTGTNRSSPASAIAAVDAPTITATWAAAGQTPSVAVASYR